MKFCMKCMNQYEDEYTVCPDCGYVEGTQPNEPDCIVPGSILADRYIVGMPCRVDGWLIQYIGWDALNERIVNIWEYFPKQYCCWDGEAEQICVKKPQQYNQYLERLREKARQLSVMTLPDSIAGVKDVFEKNGTLYIVQEYQKGILLSDYLRDHETLTMETALRLLLPLYRALDSMHDNGYIVGGFSPEQITITSDHKLFLDGYLRSIFFHISEESAVSAPPHEYDYFPYERQRSYDSPDVLPANDVYSAAMLLYQMLGGEVPDHTERNAYFQKTNKDKLRSLKSYHVKLEKHQEIAIRNALNLEVYDRTPNMENFIKELTAGTPVTLRTKRNQKMPLWLKISIPAAAVTALGIVAAVLLVHHAGTLPKDLTIVPDILQRSVEEAEEILSASDLQMQIEGRDMSDTMQENVVVTQLLNAGAVVSREETVGVRVSTHSLPVEMPNLLGMPFEQCSEVLGQIGILYSAREAYSSTVAADYVMEQSIAAGTEVTVGERVQLVVSLGPEPGQPLEPGTAQSYVGSDYASYVPSSANDSPSQSSSAPLGVQERVYDPDQPEGTIIGQNPPEGTPLAPGEPVMLTVTTRTLAAGMPDVQLLEREEAVRQLEQRGLTAEIQEENSDTVKAGLVLTQMPAPGSPLPEDRVVHLTVSIGEGTAEVPDVVGLKCGEATERLHEAGLTVTCTYTTNTALKEEQVIAQSIQAGNTIPRKSAVLLTVATHKPVRPVPDVLGLTETEAAELLKDGGFGVQLLQSPASGQSSQQAVISQYPSSGIFARMGSQVMILSGDQALVPEEAAGLAVVPSEVRMFVGEECTLHVEHAGIRDISAIQFAPEVDASEIISYQKINTDTLEFTIRAMNRGSEVFSVRYGNTVRTCRIIVN